MEPTTTEQMISGCRQNRQQSQEDMYRHFYPEMIKICSRYAADSDGAGIIYNNAMLRVFKNISSYHEQGKLAAWVHAVVVHCCIDFSKTKNIFKNSISELPVKEVSVDPEALRNISNKEVQKIIRQLPGATAAVFMLFIYEGYTHRQISEQLGISENTSKWHVSEAKLRLKIRLKALNESKQKINAIG